MASMDLDDAIALIINEINIEFSMEQYIRLAKISAPSNLLRNHIEREFSSALQFVKYRKRLDYIASVSLAKIMTHQGKLVVNVYSRIEGKKDEEIINGIPVKIYQEYVLFKEPWQYFSANYIFYSTLGTLHNGIAGSNGNILYDLNISIFNFYIEDVNTNIGIEITPLKYWLLSPEINQNISFVNMNLYANIFPLFGEFDNCKIFGPFVAVNWLTSNNFNKINVNELIYSAGLRVLWRTRLVPFPSGTETFEISNATTLLAIESGYRNMHNNHYFYITAQIFSPDAILTIIGYLMGM
jgi:hypothetical protein